MLLLFSKRENAPEGTLTLSEENTMVHSTPNWSTTFIHLSIKYLDVFVFDDLFFDVQKYLEKLYWSSTIQL